MPIPGPTLKPSNPSPCGCRVSPEPGSEKLRLWFCRTHAAAFDMLETLRTSLKTLDAVVGQLPPPVAEEHSVREIRTAVQKTIQKATDNPLEPVREAV